ncbi:hypothetical protein [Rhodoferax sp.]|jgi:hypothetical protein|uniref:hypothetical protein n=1 Tax=Rhodoferax sp. TaxID=50421 RepID=UPI0027306D03|nr:hypothetical protein [Rhodoferax sp.]MDP2443293.1 hypothetical protein [Rhodoferax sp.]MDZ4206817.1 hypothetical protein [Rhodoferax sp.]
MKAIYEVSELVNLIVQAIQRLPINEQDAAYKRIAKLMLKMPSDQAKNEIMTILEPGLQTVNGRA